MNINEFQKKTGYFFKDEGLLKAAFTHTSYANENNIRSYERLEFLGDAIVDMIVAEALFNNYPDIDEGNMSRIRAALVCEKSLAELAREIGINECMMLGHGAEMSGYRENASILSDMFEALVAAIYLDAGFNNARDYVIAVFADRIDKAVKSGDVVDYKTRLQETLQKNGKCNIVYELLEADGPVHHCLFTIRVLADAKPLGCGQAYSKKEAQQLAAKEALEKLENI